MKNFEPDELSQKLRAWKVDPRIPSSFQREVWQRIAARQTEREDAFWPATVRWISSLLVRPQYAVAVVALSLVASVAAAHLQAQESNAKDWRILEVRYATSVDPLAMSHPAHE